MGNLAHLARLSTPLSQGGRLPPLLGQARPGAAPKGETKPGTKGHQVQKDDISSGQDAGRAKAGGSPAGAAGLDLSLGHIGTQPQPVRFIAFCHACHFTMSDQVWKIAADQAGPNDDPQCPGCNRRAWGFETWDD